MGRGGCSAGHFPAPAQVLTVAFLPPPPAVVVVKMGRGTEASPCERGRAGERGSGPEGAGAPPLPPTPRAPSGCPPYLSSAQSARLHAMAPKGMQVVLHHRWGERGRGRAVRTFPPPTAPRPCVGPSASRLHLPAEPLGVLTPAPRQGEREGEPTGRLHSHVEGDFRGASELLTLQADPAEGPWETKAP